jgi:hypothetical protein
LIDFEFFCRLYCHSLVLPSPVPRPPSPSSKAPHPIPQQIMHRGHPLPPQRLPVPLARQLGNGGE